MSTPQYFSYLPNLKYTTSMNKAGVQNSVEIKDFFHLLTVRGDIEKEATVYDEYIVKNGERPEQISKKLYNDARHYWIILHANQIVDFYNQWPMTNRELDKFIAYKYGNKANDIRHYETVQVKDNNGNVLLPSGIKVTEDYEFVYPKDPTRSVYQTSVPISVTNREYEYDLNLKKSQIFVVKPSLIVQYELEVKNYGRDIKKDIQRESSFDVSDYYL